MIAVHIYLRGFKPRPITYVWMGSLAAFFFIAYFTGMIVRNTFFGVRHYQKLVPETSVIYWMVKFTWELRQSEIEWIFHILNEICHYEFGFVALLVINHFGSLQRRTQSTRSRISHHSSFLKQEAGGSSTLGSTPFLEQGGLKSFNESGLTVD